MEEWLASAGLAHRAHAFRAQRITAADLDQLTDDDLRELGLTIGERKRFRRALSAAVSHGGDAERRPLTLAFFDLRDSAGLAERLDQEDLHEVLTHYQDFCNSAVRRFGGHVAHLMGDGILAYFCYPIAHENDAERAVRAALEITRGIGTLKTPAREPLAMRVGIATGRVIVSELIAGRLVDRQSVTGTTPNLASRLQVLAPPNGIVISAATHAHIGRRFEVEDLGLRTLKGFEAPQHVYQVIGERRGLGASSHDKGQPRTPFFDRTSELATLDSLWQRACRGEGGAVLIQGIAGIGKSRLVEHFLELHDANRHASELGHQLRIVASSFEGDSPLRPFLRYVRDLAELPAVLEAEEGFPRLARALARTGPHGGGSAAALAGFLGLTVPERLRLRLPPALVRERALEGLVSHFAALSEQAPLCLVVEDVHWLDPTSLELLHRLAAQLRYHQILLLMTARAGEASEELLGGLERVDITLRPLAESEVAKMVQSLFGSEPVPSELVRRISAKADRVPLYIEELVRPLLARPGVVDWSRVAGELAVPATIPATLHEALAARLDRLGPAKVTAQIAAVIGRSIRLELLETLCRENNVEPHETIEILRRAGVFIVQDSGGEIEGPDGRPVYAFHHMLIRDAAYDSLLRHRRTALHAQLARVLLASDPRSREDQPEIIAHHLAEGGLAQEALPLWLEAGRRAIDRSALHEATRLLRRGLEVAESLSETEAVLRLRLDFAKLLGPAVFALCGPGSAEARAIYARAYELVQRLPEHPEHFPILWGWWRLAPDYLVRSERADELLRRAKRGDDDDLLMQAHHCEWASCYCRGDMQGSIEHIRLGLELYDVSDQRHSASLYGNHDAKICAHGELSQIFWMQGRFHKALQEEEKGFAWARELDHIGSNVHVMDMALLHHSYRRDFERVRELADNLIAYSADRGLPENRARGLIFLGWATAMLGEPDKGLAMLESGFDRQRQIGTDEDTPIYVSMVTEARLLTGTPERALVDLQTALREIEAVLVRNWLSEVWRLIGDATLMVDPSAVDEVTSAYDRADAIASAQRLPMLMLRNAVSRGRLDSLLGENHRAHERLARALQAIPEDDGNAELREAREMALRLKHSSHAMASAGVAG